MIPTVIIIIIIIIVEKLFGYTKDSLFEMCNQIACRDFDNVSVALSVWFLSIEN